MLKKSARQRIDEFLRTHGSSGFSAVAEQMEANQRKLAQGTKEIRTGKMPNLYYVIHKGVWHIDKDVLADEHETIKALFWFACTELGVPSELTEELLGEMDKNRELGYPLV